MFWKQSRHQALQKTIGPAPWYWNTFPSFNDWSWRSHGTKGEFAFVVALEQSPTEFLFLANIYSRVFQISDSQLGIWYPAKDETIRVVGFSVDRLQPFDATQILTNKKSEGFYCKAEPILN